MFFVESAGRQCYNSSISAIGMPFVPAIYFVKTVGEDRMQLTHQQLGELLVRARRGDRAAFDALYAATAPMQAGQIRRYLGDDKATDDILQGVYLVLWQNIGRLSQPRGLVAYLNRITYNLCMNYRRRQARETERVQGAGELEDIADRRDPVAAYDDREAVRTALGWLSENELEAVTLRYFEQLKIAQVADRMHLSERTVKRLLRAALDKMRQGLHFVFLPLPLPLLHWGAARPARDKGRAARRLLPAGIAAILCCFGAAATLRPIDIQATVQDSQPARQKTVQIQLRGMTGNNRVQAKWESRGFDRAAPRCSIHRHRDRGRRIHGAGPVAGWHPEPNGGVCAGGGPPGATAAALYARRQHADFTAGG